MGQVADDGEAPRRDGEGGPEDTFWPTTVYGAEDYLEANDQAAQRAASMRWRAGISLRADRAPRGTDASSRDPHARGCGSARRSDRVCRRSS